jgi:uncharacterized protein YydD (DUF2326 family)
MKKIIVLILLLMSCMLSYNIVTASPDSRLFRIKVNAVDWVNSIGISKADYQEKLKNKTAELESYEKALAWAEEEVVKMENTSGPVCPRTGTASKFTVTNDPRSEIKEHISKVKEEIAYLQDKIKD